MVKIKCPETIVVLDEKERRYLETAALFCAAHCNTALRRETPTSGMFNAGFADLRDVRKIGEFCEGLAESL